MRLFLWFSNTVVEYVSIFTILTNNSYEFKLKVLILFVLNWMYICLIMCLLRSSFSITQIVCLCVKLASCLEIAPVFECLRSRAEWQQVLVVFQLRSRSFLKERKKVEIACLMQVLRSEWRWSRSWRIDLKSSFLSAVSSNFCAHDAVWLLLTSRHQRLNDLH